MRRRLGMMGVVGVVVAVGALGAGSAGLAAPKPHHPKPAKAKPAHVSCSAGAAGLIAAINAANSSGGGTIELDKHCTYQLTSADNTGPTGANGLPKVTSTIVIKGHDSTIAGNNTNFRIFEVDAPNGNLTLDHVTLTGGHAVGGEGPSGGGGALLNLGGTVSIKHGLVTGNNADAGGGGITNLAGTLTVSHSRITLNTAPGGGGIATGPGNPSGTGSFTVIDHSKIDHNTANASEESGGGGIANGGILTVRHTEISDNNALGLVGGGLLNHGTATLDHTKVKGNTAGLGGGIANASFGGGGPAPQLTLKHSDVTHNTAGDGGGILNQSFGGPLGTVTLKHSHVHDNTPNNCSPTNTIAGCQN